jgi:hypothetical protein
MPLRGNAKATGDAPVGRHDSCHLAPIRVGPRRPEMADRSSIEQAGKLHYVSRSRGWALLVFYADGGFQLFVELHSSLHSLALRSRHLRRT